MSIREPGAELVLIQGLFETGSSAPQALARSRDQRSSDIARYGPGLGVLDHEWLDGRGMKVANRLLQRKRKTAPPPDAVEIMTINENALRESLASESGCAQWREFVSCAPVLCDQDRSFILMGRPHIQLERSAEGQRLLWFGNGLDHLSRAEFIAHYTTRHGPLVAGQAQLIGLRSYRQVPDEENDLCESLRELGLGRAPPPAVFGELVLGMPPLSLAVLRNRRAASREIEADEHRHINFEKSMLLLTGRK